MTNFVFMRTRATLQLTGRARRDGARGTNERGRQLSVAGFRTPCLHLSES